MGHPQVLSLKPGKNYELSARVISTGEPSSLYIYEYSVYGLDKVRCCPLNSGLCRWTFRTKSKHWCIVLAVELSGKGTIVLGDVNFDSISPEYSSEIDAMNIDQVTRPIPLSETPIWLKCDIESDKTTIISGMIPSFNKERLYNPMLARISYLDIHEIPIDGPYEGVFHSQEVGYYRYLNPDKFGHFQLVLASPPLNAAYVVLGFQLWAATCPANLHIISASKLDEHRSPLSTKTRLLSFGFVPENKSYIAGAYTPRSDSYLYLLHASLPWISNGYSTRSHGLLSAMLELGMDVHPLTRLGFPVDFAKLKLSSAPDQDKVDNVLYSRMFLGDDGLMGRHPEDLYLQKYLEEVIKHAQAVRPGLIHAASNYKNGLVGVQAGRILNTPSIYEVRGLWEITRLSRDPDWESSQDYCMNIRLETDACRLATSVITITQALKDYLVSERGIPSEKITVVPNCVNTKRFVPMRRDPELEAQYQLENKTVIGFVGSFVSYEGLELLIEAVAILKTRYKDFAVMLVGDGVSMADLETQCSRVEVNDIVIFTGRVPHDHVEKYYSLIDIAPFPRIGAFVCELVSPLKPFEAMSMGKAVVSSDVAALAEIVHDGQNGLLHRKNDAADLARVLGCLLEDPQLRIQLGEAGRNWVLAERDWMHAAGILNELYQELVTGK
jgi:glycosyltransferase involved in cell wall biosynthesis